MKDIILRDQSSLCCSTALPSLPILSLLGFPPSRPTRFSCRPLFVSSLRSSLDLHFTPCYCPSLPRPAALTFALFDFRFSALLALNSQLRVGIDSNSRIALRSCNTSYLKGSVEEQKWQQPKQGRWRASLRRRRMRAKRNRLQESYWRVE